MSPRKVVMDAVSAASGFGSVPKEGAAAAEIRELVVRTWREHAASVGINVEGLDPNASVASLIAWARANGLFIATVLSRYSTKMQHSTEAQVVECVKFAALHRMFVIPQFVCVDEAEKGRKVNRHAIKRMKAILERELVDVLLVFKLSRLFRKPYEGYRFIEQECVERRIRAIAVTQGVDTDDKKTCKPLCCLHGLSDEMLLDAISDQAGFLAAPPDKAGIGLGFQKKLPFRQLYVIDTNRCQCTITRNRRTVRRNKRSTR
jgi:hypothetical protein